MHNSSKGNGKYYLLKESKIPPGWKRRGKLGVGRGKRKTDRISAWYLKGQMVTTIGTNNMKHVKNQKRGLTFFNKSSWLWCYWKVERLYNKEYGEISRGDLYRKTLEHRALKRSLKRAGAVPWGGWTILRQIWVRKGHRQTVLRPWSSGNGTLKRGREPKGGVEGIRLATYKTTRL